jgi:hypothetical protein
MECSLAHFQFVYTSRFSTQMKTEGKIGLNTGYRNKPFVALD